MKIPRLLLCLLALLSPLTLPAQTPLDLASSFDASTEDWRATDAGATLTWEDADGNPDGCLQATGSGAVWYFASPTNWAGNWTGYQTLEFDLAIPSGHYPTNDAAGMVVIVGTNGATMTWTGPTPLWTWTFYEVSLTPDAFGVGQATFDGIMAGVSEVRILAEFVSGTETVGLDNVLLTATAPTVFNTDLRSTFTTGTDEGWTVVDDANLSVVETGRPSWSLHAADYQTGEYDKVASPPSWAGDWRNFKEIRFDMKWTSSSTSDPHGAVVTLFGANGGVVTWTTTPVRDAWTNYVVPLTPEAFGVDSNLFEGILSHVSKIWLHGEYGGGEDDAWFDNITVATGPYTPVVHTTSLISRFGTDSEGWAGYDNAIFGWNATAGYLDSGAAEISDGGTGTARFQSPDDWAGDWRAFRTLRFMVIQDRSSIYDAAVWVADYNGNVLTQKFNPPLRMWTPYTADLTAEAFGVDATLFNAVMSDVACIWINADLAGSGDTTWLDEVSVLTSTNPASVLERTATFDADAEGWTRGNLASEDWAAPDDVHWYYSASSTPPSCVVNGDSGTGLTMFYSPEAWNGDWRGYQSVTFDMKVVQGSSNNIFTPGAMLYLVSAHGYLVANCLESPNTTAWKHYEFALNPVAFGVTTDEYNRIARDVALLAIRSEWLSGTSEREAMDNVVVSTNLTRFWSWLDEHLDADELADPEVSGMTGDADQDGLNNWGEYVAGTNPTNALDALRIERASLTNTSCLLDFLSHTGRLYGIDRATGLLESNTWTQVTNNIAGNGLLMSVPASMTSTQQIYRLKVRLDE